MQEGDRHLEIHRCGNSPPPPRGMMRGRQRVFHHSKHPDQKWPETPLPYPETLGQPPQDKSSHKPWTWGPLFISRQEVSHPIKHLPGKPASSH